MSDREEWLRALGLPEETVLAELEEPDPDERQVAAAEDVELDPLDLELAHVDLGAFARVTAPQVLGERFAEGWFTAELHQALHEFDAALDRGESPRLIVEAPVRHGKSTNVSEIYPAFRLMMRARGVKTSIIIASATLEIARDRCVNARKYARAAVRAGLAAGVGFSSETDGKSHWATNARGEVYAAGLNGTVMGKGANILIIDDPIKKREEAMSAATREKTWNTFLEDLRTRMQRGGGIIIVMTRWLLDDLVGRVRERMAHEGWKVFSFAAIAEEDEPHRRKGEALFPEVMPLRELELMRQTLPHTRWLALYQQRPIPEGGDIWRREWWVHWTEGPPDPGLEKQGWKQRPETFAARILTADLSAGSESKSASYNVIQHWGITDRGEAYLLDEWRKRCGWLEARDQLKAMYDELTPHRVFIENKAMGVSMARELKLYINGLKLDPAQGSKEERALAASPHIRDAHVFLPPPDRFPWVREWIDEATEFPGGKHDDRVDTAGMAIRFAAIVYLAAMRKRAA